MLICSSLLPVVFLTLRAGSGETPRNTFWCLACGESGTLDVILNVALFTPFGLVAAWRATDETRALLWALACSLLLSATIEASQYTWVRGRDPSLSDVVANTLGGALGASLSLLLPRLQAASRRTWIVFTTSWAAAAATVLALGAWAMRFDVRAEPHYVQWEPQRPNYAPFRGQLLALWLHERSLMAGEVLLPTQLPPQYLAGDLTIRAIVAVRNNSDGTALIARIAHRSGEFLMLGQRGSSLVLRYRANAQRIGLRSPSFALGDALIPASLDTVRVRAFGGVLELESRSRTTVHSARYRVSTARFWSAFLPFERPIGALGIVGDGLWLVVLFGPVTFGVLRIVHTKNVAAQTRA